MLQFTYRFRFASTRGAIDLASIMVGLIVVGIISGVIAAAVFTVVPWSQDKAAAQNLDGVKVAQSVGFAEDGKYLNADGMADAKLLRQEASVKIATNADGTCWVATSTSATGKVFTSDSEDTTVRILGPSETTPCADLSYEQPAAPLAVSIWVHNPAELSAALATAPDGSVIGLANAIAHTVSWNGTAVDGPILELGNSRSLTLELNGQQLSVDARGGLAAIAVPGDSAITVHDNTGAGKATLRAETAAALGGSSTYGTGMSVESVGAITIDHAVVDAENTGWDGAALGGGPNPLNSVGPIRILNGSRVEARAPNSMNGAGIGGGWSSPTPVIEIDRATVEAEGGHNAAGIGAGGMGDVEGVPNGTITITASTVSAVGGATGIGAGFQSQSDLGTIRVVDSTLTAKSGQNWLPAIGGTDGTTGGSVLVEGHSTVTVSTPDGGTANADYLGSSLYNGGRVSVSVASTVTLKTSHYL